MKSSLEAQRNEEECMEGKEEEKERWRVMPGKLYFPNSNSKIEVMKAVI